MRKLLSFTVLVIFCTCQNKQVQKPLFTLEENTGIHFTNTVQDTKTLNILNYRNFYNGGGVAIGDINNDGLPDIFFTANQGSNKLYLNKGNFTFDDISARAGFTDKVQWSTGVVMVDINNDGWLDIFVCNAGHMEDSSLRKNQLFINNHDLTFTESAAKYGLDNTGYTTQVSFFDYDGDGDLDCFMINNSPISPTELNYVNKRDIPDAQWPVAPELKGGGDHLFRNDNGHFTEVTQQAGIHGSTQSFGLGVTVGDVNDDGWPDVYVSNDFYEQDYLYINQKNGTFKDEMTDWMQHTSLASMGADVGDINNDGYMDIFTTDMLPDDDYRLKTTLNFEDINVYRLKQRNGIYHQFFKNTLQLNKHNGKFADIANYAGVSASDWSWGGLMFDADNDGYLDLYVCNGINHDLINQDFIDFSAGEIMQKMIATGRKEDLNVIIDKMPSIKVLNKMFRNNGNLTFTDIGAGWGFTQPSFSNGAAYGDLDGDGDLDLVLNNVNQPAFIYRNNENEQEHHNYLSLSLRGTDKNRFAIGTIIKAYSGHQVFTRQLFPSRGFQSSMDYKIIIGLGKISQIDSLVLEWPDKLFSVYRNPSLNTTLQLVEDPESGMERSPVQLRGDSSVLEKISAAFDKHEEYDYVDFFYEKLMPRMMSHEGPKTAVGDVNGDGLEDVFIGGTIGHPGQLYLQIPGKKFVKKDLPALKQFPDFEDEAVLFFDADHDQDLDLLVCPGGNAAAPGSRQMQLRLFKNDGKGNFTPDINAFPGNQDNCSIAAAYDFNQDGYEDLFIGARCVPQLYGAIPESHLYINDGKGHFTDMDPGTTAGIEHAGMVTDAIWTDIEGKGKKDLVIVGEWMGPRIFSYQNGRFTEMNTNLSSLKGWWQSVTACDLNGDGKPDLVLGNAGENGYLRPDTTHPVKLWVNDFDNNGTTDKIITYTVDGKDKPVFLKHDLEDALPSLKKQNLRHEQYAKRSIQDLFSPEILNRAQVREFNFCASVIAINKGSGQFEIRALPPEIQFSSVNKSVCVDLNNDNNPDIILGGNLFNFQPQLERYDASFGDILLNDGEGNFSLVPPGQTGLLLTGELKDIAVLNSKEDKMLLFLQNDRVPELYINRKYLNLPKKK